MAQTVGGSEHASGTISAYTHASAHLFLSCLVTVGAITAADEVAKALLSLPSAASSRLIAEHDYPANQASPYSTEDISVPLTNECGRFQLWATNLGAHQHARSPKSADYRLLGAPLVVRRIVEVLQQLDETLENIRAILTGERLDSCQMNESPTLDSDSSSSLSQDEDTELDALLGSVTVLNTNLLKVSVIVRKGIETDRYVKANASRYRMDPSFDIRHCYEKFHVNARSPDEHWLAERLGKAITMRRQFLRYSAEHERRIAHVLPQRTGGSVPVPFSVHATSRPTQRETAASTIQLDDLIEKYAASTMGTQSISAASTHLERPGKEWMRVPDMGEISKGQGQFKCPYCYTIVAPKSRSAWKSHVFSDLRPYSCTFPICDAPMFDSKHAWFEHELSKHRCTWACPFCRQASQSDRRRGVDAPTFKSRNALAEHIHANHENQTADPDMLSAILDTSSVPETALPADSCPLCDEDWYSQVKHSYDADSAFVKMDAFRDHLGAHQEQLALFATSSNITGEESGNSDDTKSHNKAENMETWLEQVTPIDTANKEESDLDSANKEEFSGHGPTTSPQDIDMVDIDAELSNALSSNSKPYDTAALTASRKSLPAFLEKDKAYIRSTFVDLEWAQRERLLQGTQQPAGTDVVPSQWARLTGDAVTSRNRYMNVEPYAANRIKLNVPPNMNDYINASPIVLGTRRYIATQGPKDETTFDFYRMLAAECRRPVVIMLTQTHEAGREKCFQYYPLGDSKSQLDHNFLSQSQLNISASEGSDTGVVETLSCAEQPETRCQVRHLRARLSFATGSVNEQDIVHLLFSGWPDFLIPEGEAREALVRLCLASTRLVGQPDGNRYHEYDVERLAALDPLIVHCSAGVGRSGTFIALNYLLFLADSGQLDAIDPDHDPIAETVDELKKQRMMMVQGESQFQFLYEVLRERMATRLKVPLLAAEKA